MTLILETGAGSTTAEAYASAAAFAAWYLNFYGAAEPSSTAVQEAAIRRAVRYMDGLNWKGLKTFSRLAQALAWPRAWVLDRDGWGVVSSTIPPEVIEAQHMFTSVELTTPGYLSPSITIAAQKTLTQFDVMGWTPSGGGNTVSTNRPVVTMAMDRLKGLLQPGNQLVRA